MLPIRQHKPTTPLSPLDAGRRASALGRRSARKGGATHRFAAGQPPLLSPLTSQARRWRHCHVGRFETTLDASGDASDGVAPPLRYNPGGGGALPPQLCRDVGIPLPSGDGSVSRLPRPVWTLLGQGAAAGAGG